MEVDGETEWRSENGEARMKNCDKNKLIFRNGVDPRHPSALAQDELWGEGERRRIGAGWAFGACPELAEGLLSFSGGEKESKCEDTSITWIRVVLRVSSA